MKTSFLQSIWCVVPVYNNPDTVADVVRRCCEQVPNVLVIDDGSEQPVAELLGDTSATVLRHDENRGKGEALRTALRHIEEQGGEWMITLDADGQHRPEDIPLFFQTLEKSPASIVIGSRDFDAPNVPGSSRFGRRFSNFWVQLETGISLEDTQSGFRAYPVKLVSKLPLKTSHFDFEIEVLARAAWAGLGLHSVPISVYYPPPEERVSSFDKRTDNVRLTRMHARLVGRRLVPWPVHRLVKRDLFSVWELLRSPKKCIHLLLHENATPLGLGVAAGVGLILGTVPLVFLHSVSIIYVTARLNLNKVMALSIQNLCVPPVVPLLCIELGHFMHKGHFFVPDHPKTIFTDIQQHLFHWLLGSLVLAPLIGLIGGLIVYFIAKRVQPKKNTPRRGAKEAERLYSKEELSAHSAPLRGNTDPEQKKRGNRFGFWFFETVLKTSGLRPAYGFLYLVCLHYLLFDPSARRGAMATIRHAFPKVGSRLSLHPFFLPGFGTIQQLWKAYLLFVSQGKNLVDRCVHSANPTLFDLQQIGFETLDALDPNKGFVLLTAHTGNWQVAMTALQQQGRTIHLLMRPEDNPAVQKSLRVQEENERVKIISVEGPMGGMVEAMQALERGDVVSIMGDRHYGSRSVPVEFMGELAQFPCAAFLLAASSHCPVLTLLSSKTDLYTYQVEVADHFMPEWDRRRPKEEQLQEWTQRFASVLESYLKECPLQCFLFHDIWESTL